MSVFICSVLKKFKIFFALIRINFYRKRKKRKKIKKEEKLVVSEKIEKLPVLKSNKRKVKNHRESAKEVCAKRAKELIKMAEKYQKVYPNDRRISISDLKSSGILKETPRCPSGGRYVIVTNGSKIEVECLNVGGTGHGTIQDN